ncbi:MAG: RHS repeat protein [Anaerolineae bacterium]|nr:RHS repeat protein [Anaerolineae bacterium]
MTTYDALGRVAGITQPDGARTLTEYQGRRTTVGGAFSKTATVDFGLGFLGFVYAWGSSASVPEPMSLYRSIDNHTVTIGDHIYVFGE